ncbi:SPOR domain-containing protein [Arcobacter acticola]|uniref:SPOR domain-containing protein n=1 Tax=Arcobacter acticola TaxID=1849015 RepID=A0A6M8ECB8_9BACT|nr:SPOR domain-containing protein [Arcobacter acticola]QKE28120.1 SPOR domain-containing protein [Arcobacter acticola]
MQIKGEEFIKKVQLQQEREELERKLNELEEVEMSIQDEPVILSRSINNTANEVDNDVEMNDHELNNIMLGSSNNSNEENKKKYLILGIVLVVLFLLTIIIIRLLSGDTTKEDQFTSNNANSNEIKKLSENSNIEENFQKIINERVKKDSSAPMVPEIAKTTENAQQTTANTLEGNETIQQDEAPSGITNEALDETIKKIEEKKAVQKEKVVEKVTKKEPVQKEKVVERKVEEKKASKYVAETSSSDMTKGYFVQIGAFSKKPSDSYINTIRNEKFKYKIYQTEIKGTLYNKVLIGPYSSRAAANQDMDAIKEKLSVTNAFIVKF